jgi:hypothetical protein
MNIVKVQRTRHDPPARAEMWVLTDRAVNNISQFVSDVEVAASDHHIIVRAPNFRTHCTIAP